MNNIKIRKFWTINPAEKVHSTPKGLKGYDRSANKQAIEEEMDYYLSIKEIDRELEKIVIMRP